MCDDITMHVAGLVHLSTRQVVKVHLLIGENCECIDKRTVAQVTETIM